MRIRRKIVWATIT
jgi:hypothetical protein